MFRFGIELIRSSLGPFAIVFWPFDLSTLVDRKGKTVVSDRDTPDLEVVTPTRLLNVQDGNGLPIATCIKQPFVVDYDRLAANDSIDQSNVAIECTDATGGIQSSLDVVLLACVDDLIVLSHIISISYLKCLEYSDLLVAACYSQSSRNAGQ